ncbi:MAG: hypothetical protein ACP5JB_02750 [candidate division WOR-3 bacterium]|jgi:hypothetical protein
MLQDNQVIIDVSKISPEQREELANYLQAMVDIMAKTGTVPMACETCCLYSGGNFGTPVE